MKKVLIIDDEPMLLDWLFEYIESKNAQHTNLTTYDSGLAELEHQKEYKTKRYDLIIIDMNIPSSGAHRKHNEEIYQKYPGLALARDCRDFGMQGKEVIIYTVHKDQKIADLAEKIGVQYIIKSRPKVLKDAIRGAIIQHDHMAR